MPLIPYASNRTTLTKIYNFLKTHRLILVVLVLSCTFIGCKRQNVELCYNNAYAAFVRGELTKAIPWYVQCISFIQPQDERIAALAYRDLATICHLEGNNKIAFELNEKSVFYNEKAGLLVEYNDALCRSAVYKAYLGNTEEAIMQLRHVQLITRDSVIKNMAKTYLQLLQLNQLPTLNTAMEQTSATELYTSVEMLKYELYRKPFFIKVIVAVVVFLLLSFGVYATHSGLLEHLINLRKEKEKYQQQCAADVVKFCDYLHDHPEELKRELFWGNYGKMCAVVNMKLGGLIDKLSRFNTLNETEKRLCVLVLIDLQRKQISEILPYALNSVGKLKNTVAKKIHTDGKNMKNMLLNLALQGS